MATGSLRTIGEGGGSTPSTAINFENVTGTQFDDTLILGTLLEEIILDLDGGAGIDLLDSSQTASAVEIDLATGSLRTIGEEGGGTSSSAINFENVTGTEFDDTIVGDDLDNVIRGGKGNDVLSGGAGADTFVFFEEDAGVDVILDFEFGVDSLQFLTSNPEVTSENLLASVVQVDDGMALALNNKLISFENVIGTSLVVDDFLIG
ncbi:MAG: hypothetical protein AB8B60_11540 [Sulfitobacter sp.]